MSFASNKFIKENCTVVAVTSVKLSLTLCCERASNFWKVKSLMKTEVTICPSTVAFNCNAVNAHSVYSYLSSGASRYIIIEEFGDAWRLLAQ